MRSIAVKLTPLLHFFCLLILFFNTPLYSEEIAPDLVSEKKLQEKITGLENAKDLTDDVKKDLLTRYNRTLDYLDAIKSNNKQNQIYQNLRKTAPKEIKDLETKLISLEKRQQEEEINQARLKDKTPEQVLSEIKNISLSDLEQKLNSELANQAAVAAKNNNLNQNLIKETESSPGIRKRLIEANQTLEQSVADSKLPPEGKTAEEKKIRQWELDAHIEVLRSEIKKLDQQLLSQSLRLKLLKLKKAKSDLDLKFIQFNVEQLKQQVDLKRSSEIKQTQEKIRTEQAAVEGKHPLVESLAQQNTKLSEAITKRTQELIKLEASDDQVFKATQRLKELQNNTRKKLEIAGLNQIIGQVLLEQKKALPDRKIYLKNLKKRERKLAESGLEHLQYQEELSSIKNTDEYLAQLLLDISPDEQLKNKDDFLKLIKTRQSLLEKAIEIDEKYLKAISELDFAEKQFVEVANSYSQLLDEHLFWLRSAPVIGIDNLKEIPEQIKFLLLPSRWLSFLNEFVVMLFSSFYLIPALILILFFVVKKSRIKELLIHTGQKTRKISTDKLTHTWKAIAYTFLLAAPIPILLWLAGWQLSSLHDASQFTHAIADGMQVIGFPLLSLMLFRSMCLPGGLFDVHFKWSGEVIDGLRKEMGRLMLTFIPIIFVTVMLISKGESSMNGGLGRLFLLFTLLTFALFFYRLIKPESGFLTSVAKSNPDSLFARYQRLWLFIGLTTVVSLMILTIIGYVYTAGQLTIRLIYSMWFIFALIVLQQISIRWLLLTQRRYSLKMAYEKRQLAHAQKKEHDDEEDDEKHIIEFDEPEIDMVSLSEESRKLLNVGLFILTITGFFFIWSDVLPALGIFEKITLWHHQGILDGTEKIIPVTLGDLALAIIVAVISIVGAKRFPAIIEILLLNTNMNSGDRYTITTLINYSIIGIGLFVIFNILGADWSRLQWLFAALSVGIGFGLQEIVANFISGLIILFERPIRIGDYVSVGENEGVVSRIRIRATTIMTYDRKELLVPNKEFITGQLVNLSLSDPTTRIVLPVGVAYGSDIPKARALLLEAATEHEHVLAEPGPRVIFHAFGDNTLDLQLRCYIANVDYRMRTVSDINEAINEKFTQEGINIAFPQRDVHLDISKPIDINLNKNNE